MPEDMSHGNHVDRRHTQTQERYAADDLETMQEARRYSAHLFNLFRGHVGTRVLEVGSGIGTMTRPLAEVADLVVGLEPNVNCVSRLQDAMNGHPRFVLRACIVNFHTTAADVEAVPEIVGRVGAELDARMRAQLVLD